MARLRVMFMNVENLFDSDHKFYGRQYTGEEYEKKLAWIAEQIVDGHADVVGMCEFGADGDKVANDLMRVVNDNDTSGKKPLKHYYLAEPTKSTRAKIRTAVFSRYPLVDCESLVQFPDAFKVDVPAKLEDYDKGQAWVPVPVEDYSRPVCKVRVELSKKKSFNVFVVHFKSKGPKWRPDERDNRSAPIGSARSAIIRNMEAAALRYHLDSFLPQQYANDPKVPTILVGDFNDTPTSVPADTVTGDFDKDLKPNLEKGKKTWAMSSQRALVNCARLHMRYGAHEDKLFSYVFEERFSLLDHAYVSMHWVGKFKRMEMYNDHVMRHKYGTGDSEAAEFWKKVVSDHGYLILDFTGV